MEKVWGSGGAEVKGEETQQQPDDERDLTASARPISATMGDPEETTEEVAAVCVQHVAACALSVCVSVC